MSILYMIIFFFACFFLVSLILLQEGKGGGITAMGGSAMDNMVGARNPLRRWTAYFSIAIVVLALGINYTINNRGIREIPVGIEEDSAESGKAADKGLNLELPLEDGKGTASIKLTPPTEPKTEDTAAAKEAVKEVKKEAEAAAPESKPEAKAEDTKKAE